MAIRILPKRNLPDMEKKKQRLQPFPVQASTSLIELEHEREHVSKHPRLEITALLTIGMRTTLCQLPSNLQATIRIVRRAWYG
ncbi:hypothetical protein NA56DRAFT_483878 [Hyaloscypha hepaticicola]|uniref:Uncharacterized protein n=1 Tax=Hyaloscypha hepaticicola TaxID=2082293 RepID=A0A2J6PEK1_9HELO|nr:hypothetical protein NA56DRAFT_483878 [Hyaloscypha hepaticicola]